MKLSCFVLLTIQRYDKIVQYKLKNKAKEKAGKGTTKTNEAGMSKAANTMQAAQKQLNELGYKIDESRLKLSLIKM